MSIQFDIAKQIIAETCPNRKLKLENIRLFGVSGFSGLASFLLSV